MVTHPTCRARPLRGEATVTNLDARRAKRETLEEGNIPGQCPSMRLKGTENHQGRQGELHVADFARAGTTAAGECKTLHSKILVPKSAISTLGLKSSQRGGIVA